MVMYYGPRDISGALGVMLDVLKTKGFLFNKSNRNMNSFLMDP